MDEKQKVLQILCRAYVSAIFTMSMGGLVEFNDPSMVQRFDRIRVKIHSAIETYFDIGYKDNEEKQLNNIMHSLQKHIEFPIPEHSGYGKTTINRDQLKENYDKLVKKYGDRLTTFLLTTFGDRQLGGRVSVGDMNVV